jgi:lipopolysaccharide/colanic/teichoic acid biosynthesis glycosyltransferase
MIGAMPDPWTYAAPKRVLDVLLAGAVLVAVLPLLALLAAVIKLDDRRGPVLFRQERCGRDGRPFRIWKLRTMCADAEARKAEVRALSVVAWPDFRVHHDPRVTRVGRVLRRTSLDELPQLWNVVRGDMSLVGPRPTSFGSATYALWQTERLEHRPGLTGPWQLWGRSSMDFTERCRLEIAFFRRPSFLAELRVLAATVPLVIRRTGTA